MKKIFAALLALAVSVPAVSFAADADNWRDKNMGFGIGASRGVVLNGTTGLSLRFHPISDLGLELVLGGGRDKNATTFAPSANSQTGHTTYRTDSHFDLSLFIDYRFLRSNRAALSGYAGVGISRVGRSQSFVSNQAPPNTVVILNGSDSYADVAFELGLRGEVFLWRYFSVFGRVGININPYSNSEVLDVRDPQAAPPIADPNAPKAGGSNVSFFNNGDVLGMFGFTAWFN